MATGTLEDLVYDALCSSASILTKFLDLLSSQHYDHFTQVAEILQLVSRIEGWFSLRRGMGRDKN